jgi:TonB family protein
VIAETPPPVKSTPVAVQPPATPAVGSSELFERRIGVVPPVLLELPKPVMPPDVRALKEDAVYVVRVLVDEHGKVLTAIVDSGPNFKRRLREAAPEAAKKAVFQAASRDGVTGRMWTEVRIVYKAQ